MRQITILAANAFLSAKPFKSSNTTVEVLTNVTPNVTILKLHGNAIAYRYNDPQRTLSITNCGYKSNVTKERLNALPNVNIQQKGLVWFLNGVKWDGSLIDINY